jgi:shikimate kinase
VRVFVIGGPGAGNTPAAGQLARHLDAPLIDLDRATERRCPAQRYQSPRRAVAFGS